MRQQAAQAQQRLQQRFKQNSDTVALPQELSDGTPASANQQQLERLDWELNYWRTINAFAWSYAERMKQTSGPQISALQQEAVMQPHVPPVQHSLLQAQRTRPAFEPHFPTVQQDAVALAQNTPETPFFNDNTPGCMQSG